MSLVDGGELEFFDLELLDKVGDTGEQDDVSNSFEVGCEGS